MSAIQQQKDSISWDKVFKSFNSLHWYDVFTSFVFRFMAKTSEPLLAAGVIVSAIDFLQRGELLANNTELSLWWSVAQGVAMEVSVGPVLVLSLDAHEEGDKTKAIMYASLSGMLAVVGGAMLFLQFALTVGGLHDNQISPFVIWPLFLLRTVASISYIALSCTKHKRFSGISPQIVINETNKAFDEATVRFVAMQNSTMQAIEQIQNHLTYIETSFNNRLMQMNELNDVRLQEVQRSFVNEVSTVRVTLEKQSQVIKQLPEPKPLTNNLPNEFDKGSFVRNLLTKHSEMSGAEIQRKASEQGYKISAGYISDIRKSLTSEHEAIQINATASET